MAYPPLVRGDRNLAVRAAQNSLHRILDRRGIAHRNLRNGTYGALTAKDVENLEVEFDIRPVTPANIGARDWDVLKHGLSKWDRSLLARYAAQEAARRALEAARRDQAQRAKAAALARDLHARGGLIYVQRRPFPLSLHIEAIRYRLDCSSFATLCYWGAGLPDPNGWGYAGQFVGGIKQVYGWTGSLWAHGTSIPLAQVNEGDLVFYGWDMRGAPQHVAVAVGGGEVVSFGSTPIRRLPIDYRPILGCRRYPVR